MTSSNKTKAVWIVMKQETKVEAQKHKADDINLTVNDFSNHFAAASSRKVLYLPDLNQESFTLM